MYIYDVKDDVLNYINNEIDMNDFASRGELETYLNDELFCNDSVTGNASGSYTFNNERAREYVFDDMETVKQALREFCVSADEIAERFLDDDMEYFDVTARCYILPYAVSEVVDEMDDDLFPDD